MRGNDAGAEVRLSPQISDERYADTDASMRELASSDARLTPSFNGSDVAMTDIEENVLSAGQMSSELLPNFTCSPCFQCGKHDDRQCPAQQ